MGFVIPETPERSGIADKGVGGILDTQPKDKELPSLKPEDIQYFGKLIAVSECPGRPGLI